MRIHHSPIRRGYTKIPNAALRDTRLSYTARGVLAELLSRPDGWETNADRMADSARLARGEGRGEGRRALRAAYAELEAAGYMLRRVERGPGGRIVTRLEVFDAPQHRGTADGTSVTGTSVTGMPVTGTSVSGTPLGRTETQEWEEVEREGVPASLRAGNNGQPKEPPAVPPSLQGEVQGARARAAEAWGTDDRMAHIRIRQARREAQIAVICEELRRIHPDQVEVLRDVASTANPRVYERILIFGIPGDEPVDGETPAQAAERVIRGMVRHYVTGYPRCKWPVWLQEMSDRASA